MKPNDTVKLPSGETGTIERPSALKHYDWVVRVHGAVDHHVPPWWDGEITEEYRADELIVVAP